MDTWDQRARRRLPAPALPTPCALNGPARLAEFYLMQTKEHTNDVEAALGPSQRLTETVCGRDLANLHGRRRGTKDFLGRVANTTPSAEPRSKAPPADPVDVFGAASRGYRKCRQTFDAGASVSTGAAFRNTRKTKELFFRIPGCAHLTFEAIDGFRPHSTAGAVAEAAFFLGRDGPSEACRIAVQSMAATQPCSTSE